MGRASGLQPHYNWAFACFARAQGLLRFNWARIGASDRACAPKRGPSAPRISLASGRGLVEPPESTPLQLPAAPLERGHGHGAQKQRGHERGQPCLCFCGRSAMALAMALAAWLSAQLGPLWLFCDYGHGAWFALGGRAGCSLAPRCNWAFACFARAQPRGRSISRAHKPPPRRHRPHRDRSALLFGQGRTKITARGLPALPDFYLGISGYHFFFKQTKFYAIQI